MYDVGKDSGGKNVVWNDVVKSEVRQVDQKHLYNLCILVLHGSSGQMDIHLLQKLDREGGFSCQSRIQSVGDYKQGDEHVQCLMGTSGQMYVQLGVRCE